MTEDPVASDDELDLRGAIVVGVGPGRWAVRFAFQMPDGSEQEMIASADRGYTDGDGIWWGTREEYDQWEG